MHIISIQHWHSFLQNDCAVVQMFVNKMHGASRYFNAIFQRLFLRVHAGKCRQQRRMNVDDAIGKSPYEIRRQQSHVPGQADQVHLRLFQGGYHFGIVLFARPDVGAVTLALLFGLYSMIYGFSQITAGVQLRQLGSSVRSLSPLNKAA